MFFLKYRPQTVDQLDLDSVRVKLGKILEQKDLPHAFLFAGPKGTGKTSAARVLAKAVNCRDKKDFEPCNQCEICREITGGFNLDVLEIDAASNRGIDDVRQLKEKIGLSPLTCRFKVYIIDEVHMLTKEAFNALLKTLEEPPAHIIFILCTTDPDKIIPTVLSRLVRVDFTKGNKKEMERSLDKVIKAEKLKVDEKVVTSIIDLSDGGFRDGHKILESLVISLGKKINWQDAAGFLEGWQKQRPETILKLIAEGNLKEVLQSTEELAVNGVDFTDYIGRILDLIQKMILVKAGLGGDTDSLFEIDNLVTLSRLFSKASVEQKTTPLAQLPFQLAVIDYLFPPKAESKQPKVDSQKLKVESRQLKAEGLKPITRKKTDARIEEIITRWDELLSAVKPMNHSVAAFLRSAKPKEFSDNTLILEVFYRFHKDKLEESRNRQIVEDGLLAVFSSKIRVKCVLKEGKKDDLYEIAKEIFT